MIGPRAEIGAATVIGPGAVIGPDVRIGRDCAIGANASITHALIGDRVIIHAGARIGQDGFGYLPGPGGHRKVPQLGRVIVQDDVEIGANTTIDRGASRDTVIGEGTKIDNLVQIAHNVTIGRHCLLAGQVGISGSVTVGDYVMMARRSGPPARCSATCRRERNGWARQGAWHVRSCARPRCSSGLATKRELRVDAIRPIRTGRAAPDE